MAKARNELNYASSSALEQSMLQTVIRCVAKKTATQKWMARKKILEGIRGGARFSTSSEPPRMVVLLQHHKGVRLLYLFMTPPETSIKHRIAFHGFSSYYWPDSPPIRRGVPILYSILVRLYVKKFVLFHS